MKTVDYQRGIKREYLKKIVKNREKLRQPEPKDFKDEVQEQSIVSEIMKPRDRATHGKSNEFGNFRLTNL